MTDTIVETVSAPTQVIESVVSGPVGPAGAAGADGSDGLSAYEIAVANGFVGNEAAWLASLVGATGAAGATGATGSTGATGATGPQGPAGADGGAAEGYTVVVKSANQDVTNADVTDDSELSFSVVAGGHYMVSMDVAVSANNTTGDYAFCLSVSAGTMKGRGTCSNLSASATAQTVIVTVNDTASSLNVACGASAADIEEPQTVRILFACMVSADATFSYRFGNNGTGSGRTSRTWKGSILRYKRLD